MRAFDGQKKERREGEKGNGVHLLHSNIDHNFSFEVAAEECLGRDSPELYLTLPWRTQEGYLASANATPPLRKRASHGLWIPSL